MKTSKRLFTLMTLALVFALTLTACLYDSSNCSLYSLLCSITPTYLSVHHFLLKISLFSSVDIKVTHMYFYFITFLSKVQ